MKTRAKSIESRFKFFLRSLGVVHVATGASIVFFSPDLIQMGNLLQSFMGIGESIAANDRNAWFIFAGAYFVTQGALFGLQAERSQIWGFGLTLLLAKVATSAAWANLYFFSQPKYFWYLLCFAFESLTGLGWLWATLVLAWYQRPWARNRNDSERPPQKLDPAMSLEPPSGS